MPLTTRPLSTSKHGITRLVSMVRGMVANAEYAFLLRGLPSHRKQVHAHVSQQPNSIDDSLVRDAQRVRRRAEGQVFRLRLGPRDAFDRKSGALVQRPQFARRVRPITRRENVVRVNAAPAV